jgi:riboflavin kinase/FMN adenylyltransferase
MTRLLHSESWVIALGNFDGVHLGHQMLIKKAVQLAQSFGVPAKVVTFNPHPMAILSPPHTRLMSVDHQKNKIKSLGCLKVEYLTFDQTLRETSALDFLECYLQSQADIRAIVVGFNFRFGKNRQGDSEFLQKWGAQNSIHIEVVPPVKVADTIVSTSEIRKYLREGLVEKANQLLGHNIMFQGIVVKGDQRGRKLGFPTMNLSSIETQLPAPGVYIAQAQVEGASYWGCLHIGELPTFGILSPRVELHLLDFQKDVYGQTVEVQILQKVRDIQSFLSVADLRVAIQRDIKFCREWLNR